MRGITNKLKKISVKRSVLALAFVLTAVSMAVPSTALAASKTYALLCPNSTVQIGKSNKLSCKPSGDDVTVQGIGSQKDAEKAGTPYPDTVKLTIVSVDCGSSSPKDPKLGSTIESFDCQKGSVKDIKQTGTYGPIGTAQSAQTGPYSVDPNTDQTVGSNNAAQGTAGQANANCDPNDALCSSCDTASPGPGCPSCKNGICNDAAATPNGDCNRHTCDLIQKYVNPTINLLTMVFGLIAVISIIMGGIQYSAAGGDSQKITKAKQRISKTLIALIVYLFLYTFLQFIIPGGVFKG